MDSEPKQNFNNQVIPQLTHTTDINNTNFYISPLKRILTLIKNADLNGLQQFFNSTHNNSFNINELNKDLKQTVLYQAVQIKDKPLALAFSKLLIENGVNI